MIQLYAKVADLKPTESKELVETIGEFKDWWRSITLYGIDFCLHVDSQGKIRDGNARYWIAKTVGLEYAPINLQFFIGLQFSTQGLYPSVPLAIDQLIRKDFTDKAYTEVRKVIK